MKSLIKISLLLLSIIILIACEKKNEFKAIFEIPVEERCIFKKGDTLLYMCNDGSTDTACIIYVDFWTHIQPHTSSWSIITPYKMDNQKIVIEALFNDWNLNLNNFWTKIPSQGNRFNSPCYGIQTIGSPTDNFPTTSVVNGCEWSGWGIASGRVNIIEITLNGKKYKKVYGYPKGNSSGWKIYWNLKYGIIRFEFISDGSTIIWDLEGKI